MTVCVAAICRYIYGENDYGSVVVTASDRMLTNEGLGIEYEPTQGKWAKVANRVVILVADNISIHSVLLQRLRKDTEKNPDISVKEVAELYALYLREFSAAKAAQLYLSPYGLNLTTFIEKQKKLIPELAMDLANKLLEYEVKAEALVVGCDGENNNIGHIYSVNNRGIITCHDDIGFAAIGIGEIHATTQFMGHAYSNTWDYYSALLLTYSAKKKAETAPGVGKSTDMEFISREGAFTLHEGMHAALNKVYPTYEVQIKKVEAKTREALQKEVNRLMKKEEKEKLKKTKTSDSKNK